LHCLFSRLELGHTGLVSQGINNATLFLELVECLLLQSATSEPPKKWNHILLCLTSLLNNLGNYTTTIHL